MEDTLMFRLSREQLSHEVPKLEHFFLMLSPKAYINALKRLGATMWKLAIERYNDLLKEHADIFQHTDDLNCLPSGHCHGKRQQYP